MFRELVFHFNPTYLTLIGNVCNVVIFVLRSPATSNDNEKQTYFKRIIHGYF